MNIYYTIELLPEEYEGTPVQKADRSRFTDFLNGKGCDRILEAMTTRINRITGAEKAKWVICFIPSSDDAINCYKRVASSIEQGTGVRAAIDSISRKIQSYSESVADFDYSTSYFAGKHVILIEDVVRKGVVINSTARHLINLGATSVTGFAVAKTINPSWAA